MKVKYNRPLNLQDIIDQLKIMQAIGKIDTISELIEDIEWLKKKMLVHIKTSIMLYQ
ncbi:hypothetical protein UM818_01460 [Staphylococcus aureus]|uniref:hypothetical protein n=1 Tax=Staphylococcus aureus TaxID=1280 RepID=UPI000ADA5A5E|nr:hypothetical protein [Staphylococcus aureus]WIO53545.1 hypothetical protein QQO08_11105 [Staphylococcus aureus]WRN34742.1 hypothetical protein UM818_01460 [Staphylococcus aureus]WRN81389.1 hypothetical protein UM654_06225 [Staphylococcus aureus]